MHLCCLKSHHMKFYKESHPFTLTFEFLVVYVMRPTSHPCTNLTCTLVGAFLLAIPLSKKDVMYMILIPRKFSLLGMFFYEQPHHLKINMTILFYPYHLMKSQPLCPLSWLTPLILHHFPKSSPHRLWKLSFLSRPHQFHHKINPFFITLIDLPRPLLISKITKLTMHCYLL